MDELTAVDPGLFDLTGQVALVTGGNSGIGLGMARGLGAAGAQVCLWGTNTGKNAAALEDLRSHDIVAEAFLVDVRDEDAVERGVGAAVERFGRIDSCFANAGMPGQFGDPSFLKSTFADWRAGVSVNLDGAYLTLRGVARQMVAQGDGGSLVGTSSLAAVFGAPRAAAYSASKAGVIALMNTLAVELGRYGIRANTLVPGWTRSPQFDQWLDNPAVTQSILPRVPLGRWGTPDEWAGVAVYLASRASSFHTGDTFRIDGGYGVY